MDLYGTYQYLNGSATDSDASLRNRNQATQEPNTKMSCGYPQYPFDLLRKRDSFISLIAQFDYTMLHRFIISEYPGPGVNPHFCSAKKTWSGYHATTGHLPIGRLQQLGHHQVLVSSLVIQFVPQRAPQLRSS